MQVSQALINELQLGTRLNASVEANRRGEFGLLLAMLSTDSRDMAQFQINKELSVEQKLYKQFELPPAQDLVDNLAKDAIHIDNANAFYQGETANSNIKQFHLMQSMRPEALVIRGELTDDMSVALANSSYLTQLKAKNAKTEAKYIEDMHFLEQLERQRQLSQTIAMC